MSVLVKGMEMPTRCFSCPMCDVENAEVNCAISHGFYIEYREVDPKVAIQERPDWCPLIEVPPHGRLIDADALMLQVQEYIEEYGVDIDEHGFHSGKWCAMKETEMEINDAPTVIPADNQGGDA